MIYHGKIKEFNEVVETYKNYIMIYSNMRPDANIRIPVLLFTPATYARMTLNSVAYNILCVNEEIDKYISKYNEKYINNLIKDAIEKVIPFDNIIKKEEMSNDETRKQIRNCFAHAHFSLIENQPKENSEDFDLNNFLIKFENKKIKFILSYEQFIELENSFLEIIMNIEDKTDIISIIPIKAIQFKNLNEIKKDLDLSLLLNLRPKKTFVSQDIDQLVVNISNEIIEKGIPINRDTIITIKEKINALKKEGYNFFDYKLEKYPEEAKNRIINYIKLIRISKFNNIPQELKKEIITRSNRHFLYENKFIVSPNDMLILLHHFNNIVAEDKQQLIEKHFYYNCYKKQEYFSIFHTAEKMLELCYYVFNFSKETLEGYNDIGFNLYFDNINGVKNILLSNSEWCKEIKSEEHINNKIKNVQQEIHSKIRTIKKCKKSVKNLENPKNRNPKKKEILEEVQKNIIETYNKLKILREEEQKLLKELKENKNCEPYYDCTNFFRHLRNSLSHPARHRVIYDDALKNDDFEQLKYNFTDDEGKFDVTISDKQLVTLINMMSKKINEYYTKNSIYDIEKAQAEKELYKKSKLI